MSDFESGIIPAINYSFPAAKHWGCNFHFTQCLTQNIKSTGLSTENNNKESELHKWLKLFLALPFVSPNDYYHAADLILENKPLIYLNTELEQKIQDFINYFKSTWVLDKTHNKNNKKIIKKINFSYSKSI